MPYVRVEKSIGFFTGRTWQWRVFGKWHVQAHLALRWPRYATERIGSFDPMVVIQFGPFVIFK